MSYPPSTIPVGGKIVTSADFEKLTRSFSNTIGFAAIRDQAMIWILWVTGMRRSDLNRLSLDDLAEKNTVAVSQGSWGTRA